jgi:hypothetical protein
VLNYICSKVLFVFVPYAMTAATIEKKLRSFLWSGKEEGNKLCNVR